jgi:hypothetical protein
MRAFNTTTLLSRTRKGYAEVFVLLSATIFFRGGHKNVSTDQSETGLNTDQTTQNPQGLCWRLSILIIITADKHAASLRNRYDSRFVIMFTRFLRNYSAEDNGQTLRAVRNLPAGF